MFARASRAAAVAALTILCAAPAARADRTEPLPAQLEGVHVTEHLDGALPEGLTFVETHGITSAGVLPETSATLGSLLHKGKPVILTFNYSSCPMLCTLELNGLVESLLGIDWSIGKDFDVVTIDIDPKDDAEKLARFKKTYVGRYGRDGAETSWHFLRGDEASIKALASAVGFGYQFLPERNEFAHGAAIVLLTPDAKVGRYLYGVKYDSGTMRMGLVESAQGQLGTTMEQFLLYCFHYDESAGKYSLSAMKLMRASAAIFLVFVGFAIWRLKRGEATKLVG